MVVFAIFGYFCWRPLRRSQRAIVKLRVKWVEFNDRSRGLRGVWRSQKAFLRV